MNSSLEQHWMQRARALTQALIISGTLNIGLVSTFIYFTLKDKQSVVSQEVPSAMATSKPSVTNEQVLLSYSQSSFSELVGMLKSEELLEEGYTERDLALACLTAFHHFPLTKVLGEAVLQKRKISFSVRENEIVELLVFPGLKTEHFEAVLQFAHTEKWPLSAKGLFLAVQGSQPPYDPSLLEALSTTSEFHHIYILLQKGIPALERSVLVDLLQSGSWDKMKEIAEKLRVLQCYDVDSCREVLMTYALNFHSKVAGRLLVQHHAEYIMKRLNDEQLIAFLDLHVQQEEILQPLAKELLLSPRSDEVRQKAAAFLYAMAQEIMPQPYDHQVALTRFFPERSAPAVLKVLPKQEPIQMHRIHIVQAGESLWKIARKYQTTVDAISKLNHLESDRLKLGKKLQIPESLP
ncbi:MAG: LysM peptidoglycan-binding domain-containing protein [Rhabdochlamydiaceae bacterium]|nr:LysM peptidoglycan-binding domain-containing protein [Rhabdochlamydiaceae bacterium]